jgi:hypothetical protein
LHACPEDEKPAGQYPAFTVNSPSPNHLPLYRN